MYNTAERLPGQHAEPRGYKPGYGYDEGRRTGAHQRTQREREYPLRRERAPDRGAYQRESRTLTSYATDPAGRRAGLEFYPDSASTNAITQHRLVTMCAHSTTHLAEEVHLGRWAAGWAAGVEAGLVPGATRMELSAERDMAGRDGWEDRLDDHPDRQSRVQTVYGPGKLHAAGAHRNG
ncbi:hypothetical protein KCP73_01440 [Salmonella enterica subsp. enterica]|nr:hypothetical protein KCP73_01440 [Salmonella enterica subsp. enterica]